MHGGGGGGEGGGGEGGGGRRGTNQGEGIPISCRFDFFMAVHADVYVLHPPLSPETYAP